MKYGSDKSKDCTFISRNRQYAQMIDSCANNRQPRKYCKYCCGDKKRTCVLRKRPIIAKLCTSLCIHCNRLPPPFCLAHSPVCSLTPPRLHKIVLLRQRKMLISIRGRDARLALQQDIWRSANCDNPLAKR